ncbi:MAG: HAD-IA family hydrolase [Synechococcales bacterium]|nr:HAD-IA family hydrolase [Synechococcales bacterium]
MSHLDQSALDRSAWSSALPYPQNLGAILYDLDGTLANTDPIHFLAWQQCLRDWDLAIDHSFYQTQISGKLNPDIVAHILPQLDRSAAEALADRKEALFRELAQGQLTALPGLERLLQWAKSQGLPQALVTNAPPDNVQFLLRVLNLENFFEPVILAEELPKGKPDPLPYQIALEKLGLQATQTIALEDSPSGIRSAVAAGMPTIGVTSTHGADPLMKLGAATTLADFTDENLWQWLAGA